MCIWMILTFDYLFLFIRKAKIEMGFGFLAVALQPVAFQYDRVN